MDCDDYTGAPISELVSKRISELNKQKTLDELLDSLVVALARRDLIADLMADLMASAMTDRNRESAWLLKPLVRATAACKKIEEDIFSLDFCDDSE